MAVRNLRSIGNVKPIPVFHFIPPTNFPIYKITIERLDGTIDDISELLTAEGTINNSINGTIGNFEVTIDNSTENYTNVWTGKEIFRFYSDYSTTVSTLTFRGIVEKVSYINNSIKIMGRTDSLDLLNLIVTYATTAETSVILSYLFDTYTTKFTKTNLLASSTTIKVSWYQKPFIECIQELCNASGFDFYIDCNLDVHYFESGSIRNTNECLVHESNILSIDDFGQDYSLIKNKVIVQGNDGVGLPVLWTEYSDDADYGINSSLGLRIKQIKDNDITDVIQAKDRAVAELAFALEPNSEGSGESIGLATLQPGEQIAISAPSSGLNNGYYTINSFTHKVGGDMFKTILNINKQSVKFQNIIKKTTDWATTASGENVSTYDDNSENMEFSYNLDFSKVTSGSFTNSVIFGGYLKTDGSASGIWESDLEETSFDLTALIMRVNGDNLSTIKIFVSLDGGSTSTYRQIYGLDVPGIQNMPSGRTIKIKVFLNSVETIVKGIALLYK